MEQNKLDKINKIFFYGFLVIIVLLLLVNIQINAHRHNFDKYCINQYDIDAPCPCDSPKTSDFGTFGVNFTSNYSFNPNFTEKS